MAPISVFWIIALLTAVSHDCNSMVFFAVSSNIIGYATFSCKHLNATCYISLMDACA